MKKLFGWVDTAVNRLVTNYALMLFITLAVAAFIALEAKWELFLTLPSPPVYATYVQPQKEWSDDRRERYYQTTQGSLVLPYAWFKALEYRTGREMFSSPEVQTRYGLLPDNNPKYNPDHLPVGIVNDVVEDDMIPTLGLGEKNWASISCAACHTGQLLYKGTAFRVDGGQSFWNFDRWSGDLVFSLFLTSATPTKFDRFCSRVYGHDESGRCSDDEEKALRSQLKRYFNSNLIIGAVNGILNHTYPLTESFTRTAALGRGVNGEFEQLSYKNVYRNTGPVSFPPLWYTHYFDWVQSPAAIRQPLGRNVTEAWGVSVQVELKDPAKRFSSTAAIAEMFWMETLLSTLRPPQWPEDIFGRIDKAKAERGKVLFNDAVWPDAPPAKDVELEADAAESILGPNPGRPTKGYCARCHAPAYNPVLDINGRRSVQLPLYRMEIMGTDPDDAMQFRARNVQSGDLPEVFNNQKSVGIGVALQDTVPKIIDYWFSAHNVPKSCQPIMEGFRPNAFRAPPAYPARPLDGYWATGPFLHNGSVRTMYELLSPIEERAKTFYLGSREFDPRHLGFQDIKMDGAFLFDTSLQGNSRAGHEFRDAPRNTPGVIGPKLTPEQRMDIIEYLKVLNSFQVDQDEQAYAGALLISMAPFFEKDSAQGYGIREKDGGWKMTDLCTEVEKVAASQKSQMAMAQPKRNGYDRRVHYRDE